MLLPLSVAASDYYSVRIGGWIFNSDFLTMDNSNNDAIVSGSATYNPSTNTLTLNNLVCEMEDYNFIILVDDSSPLKTIQLVGNCVFRSSYGDQLRPSVHIRRHLIRHPVAGLLQQRHNGFGPPDYWQQDDTEVHQRPIDRPYQ